MALVGDVMVETSKVVGFERTSPGFGAAIDRLKSNDLVIGNLEMPLSERGSRVRKYSNLRSHPSVIDGVMGLGLHAVSLANNHMMDYGPESLADTLETVSAAGLESTGAGLDIDAAMRPVILTCGARTVGMLSFACTLPMESAAGVGKPGIAPIHVGFSFEVDTNLMAEQPGTVPVVHSWTDPEDRARACDSIAALRREVDVVVVMIHWGVPNFWLSPSQGYLASYQQILGHAMVDAGADVICGHHAHSLHPIEIYRGQPIFYSVGNFLFEGARAFMEPESVIVEMNLETGSFNLVPLYLDADGFPELATGEQSLAVLEKLRIMSQPYGDNVRIVGDRGELVLTTAEASVVS